MDSLLLLADLAPTPSGLPTHVWWRLLAGVIGLAVVGAILLVLMSLSFRRVRRTVRDARAEHAALSEQLLADARAEGARVADARRRDAADEE